MNLARKWTVDHGFRHGVAGQTGTDRLNVRYTTGVDLSRPQSTDQAERPSGVDLSRPQSGSFVDRKWTLDHGPLQRLAAVVAVAGVPLSMILPTPLANLTIVAWMLASVGAVVVWAERASRPGARQRGRHRGPRARLGAGRVVVLAASALVLLATAAGATLLPSPAPEHTPGGPAGSGIASVIGTQR